MGFKLFILFLAKHGLFVQAIINMLFMHAVTDLQRAFLHHVGGISKKSFVQILNADSDDNDISNQPPIIQHSSFYDR